VHVDPAAQVVGPVHPMPPPAVCEHGFYEFWGFHLHCPYFGAVPPLPVPVAAAELLVELELEPEVGLEPAPEVHVETDEGPVGVVPLRTQPDFAVRAAGHVTGTKVTPGLSELPNQSKRQ
jgi:hypothetical protein